MSKVYLSPPQEKTLSIILYEPSAVIDDIANNAEFDGFIGLRFLQK